MRLDISLSRVKNWSSSWLLGIVWFIWAKHCVRYYTAGRIMKANILPACASIWMLYHNAYVLTFIYGFWWFTRCPCMPVNKSMSFVVRVKAVVIIIKLCIRVKFSGKFRRQWKLLFKSILWFFLFMLACLWLSSLFKHCLGRYVVHSSWVLLLWQSNGTLPVSLATTSF